jgi:hypothetical protein
MRCPRYTLAPFADLAGFCGVRAPLEARLADPAAPVPPHTGEYRAALETLTGQRINDAQLQEYIAAVDENADGFTCLEKNAYVLDFAEFMQQYPVDAAGYMRKATEGLTELCDAMEDQGLTREDQVVLFKVRLSSLFSLFLLTFSRVSQCSQLLLTLSSFFAGWRCDAGGLYHAGGRGFHGV